MIVNIKDKWWERIKIIRVVYFILQFKSLVEERIAVVIYYLCLLLLRNCIPTNDVRIRSSLSICSRQVLALINVSSDLNWVWSLFGFVFPCFEFIKINWTIPGNIMDRKFEAKHTRLVRVSNFSNTLIGEERYPFECRVRICEFGYVFHVVTDWILSIVQLKNYKSEICSINKWRLNFSLFSHAISFVVRWISLIKRT